MCQFINPAISTSGIASGPAPSTSRRGGNSTGAIRNVAPLVSTVVAARRAAVALSTSATAALDERERLIVVRTIEPRQQDRHRAFAAEADAPDQIVRAAGVVVGNH